MRRIVLATLVVLALIGLWLLIRPPLARSPAPSRPTQVRIHRTGRAEGRSETKAGRGAHATSPATRTGAATPPPAPASVPPAEGGVVAPLYAFFADLASGQTLAAYHQMAASWRQSHPYALFLSYLPKTPPTLVSVRLTAVGNFTAEAEVVVRSGGRTVPFAVPLVNEAGPPGRAPSGVLWRIAAMPAAPAKATGSAGGP